MKSTVKSRQRQRRGSSEARGYLQPIRRDKDSYPKNARSRRMQLDTFQRAAVIALAWCLIGLGIDTQPDRNRSTSVDRNGHFASTRLHADTQLPERPAYQIKRR